MTTARQHPILTAELREAGKRLSEEYLKTRKSAVVEPEAAIFERKILRWLQALQKRLILATVEQVPSRTAEARWYAEHGAPQFLLVEATPVIKINMPLASHNLFQAFDKVAQDATDISLGWANEHIAKCYTEGWNNGKPLISNVGSGFTAGTPTVNFALSNQRAEEWAKKNAANLVRNVSASTMQTVRDLVVDSRAQGQSYATLARRIAEDPAFGAARAKTIAVTELARAYERGNADPALMLHRSGVPMEKEWLTHSMPCDQCGPNKSEGWIDIEDSFGSGDLVAPAHPNCRCSVAYRRIGQGQIAPPAPLPPKVDTDAAGNPVIKPPSENPADYKSFGSTASGSAATYGTAAEKRAYREINDWGETAYKDWASGVNVAEREAIDYYQGSGYAVINEDYKHGRLNITGKTVGQALERAEATEDVMVWRGATDKSMKGKNVGDTILRKSFSSTSLNEETAHQFLSGYMAEERVLYRVLIPKGTKGVAYVEAATAKQMGEAEMLMNAGSHWKIVKDDVEVRSTSFGDKAIRVVTVVVVP